MVRDRSSPIPPLPLRNLRSNLAKLLQFNEGTRIIMNIATKPCACDLDHEPMGFIRLLRHVPEEHKHHCDILKRDAFETLEFVEDMDFADFGILRRLNDAKMTLLCIVVDVLELSIAETKDIDYDA
jgi:hypothetical protein